MQQDRHENRARSQEAALKPSSLWTPRRKKGAAIILLVNLDYFYAY